MVMCFTIILKILKTFIYLHWVLVAACELLAVACRI